MPARQTSAIIIETPWAIHGRICLLLHGILFI